MVAPLSDVPQEGSSVFSLFSLIKLHLASLPLASSYSRVAVSSVFWAQNIFFSAQTRGAPLSIKQKDDLARRMSDVKSEISDFFYVEYLTILTSNDDFLVVAKTGPNVINVKK